MFFVRKSGLRRVERGVVSGYDFTIGDFTRDNTWREMDLSSIVPANAKWVTIYVSISTLEAMRNVRFRKKNELNDRYEPILWVHVATGVYTKIIILPIGSDGIIEYSASVATGISLDVVVLFYDI